MKVPVDTDAELTDSSVPRYRAFVSYSHHDRRIAHWLVSELSKIRVPKRLRNVTNPGSTRLTNVFLDETSSSASSNLSDGMQAALRASSALIVVCSPFAAASEYVSGEIQYFQSLGRGDRIFCIIGSGVPNASDTGNNQLECFPEPLRTRARAQCIVSIPLAERPLGINVGEESITDRRRVSVAVAAGIMKSSHDELRGERRKRVMAVTAVVVCICLGLTVAGGAMYFPFVTYARELETINGVPRALHEISARVASQLPESYKIERRGLFGKPSRVSIVNGFGSCPMEGLFDPLRRDLQDHCSANRACSIDYSYDSTGMLSEVRWVSPFGQVLERLKYTEPSVGLFTEAGFGCSRSKSGIRYVTYERYGPGRDAGRDRAIHFFGESSSGERIRRSNDAGAFGYLFHYQPSGDLSDEFFLGPDGGISIGDAGFAGIRFSFGIQGEPLSRTYVDPLGQPTVSNTGTSTLRFRTDGLGREVSQAAFDSAGQPTGGKEGIWATRTTYGIRGTEVRWEFLDPLAEATENENGVATIVRSYDRHGYVVLEKYLDKSGIPNGGKECAIMLISRGSRGELLRVQTFNADQSPCFSEGATDRRYAFDARGNRISQQFFDERGRPALWSGCHRSPRRYDAEGRVISVTCFGIDNEPYAGIEGAAEVRSAYDVNGNLAEESYFGVDGRPAPQKHGAATRKFRYDDRGLLVWEGQCDIHGQPNFSQGYTAISRSYDTFGRVSEQWFLDADGRRVSRVDGYAGYRSSYDRFGREIRTEYLDPAGDPVTPQWGAAVFAVEYNSHGDRIRQSNFDARKQPTRDSSGVAEYRFCMDPRGHETCRRFFDVDGNASRDTEGIAGWNDVVDRRGNVIERRFIAQDGTAAASKTGAYGWRAQYDAQDRQLLVVNLGEDGKPTQDGNGVAGHRKEFDRAGRLIVDAFVDADLKETLDRHLGYARRQITYDEWGREQSTRYFGVDRRPALADGGYAALVNTYNARGFLVHIEFLDLDGTPAAHRWASSVDLDYDDFGRQIRRHFRDKQGRVTIHPSSGRAIVETSYDAAGRIVRIVSLDASRHLVNRKDVGFAVHTYTYAPNGVETSRHCERADGSLLRICPEED